MAKLSKVSLKGKQPITRELLIPADEAASKRLEEARSAVSRTKLLGSPEEAQAAAEALERVTADVRESGLEFTFRGIGRKRYEALVREHKPTNEQKAEAELEKQMAPQWDVDTFPAALCHASAVDSDLSAEDWVTDIFESEDWGPGELSLLFNTAFVVNSDRRVAELGN